MGSASIVAPDGRRWKVRRRWAPRLGKESAWGRFRHRVGRTARRTGDVVGGGDPGCLDVFGEGILIALAIVAAVLIVLFVLVPLIVAVVDLVFVLLVALLGVVVRIVFRRPWTVEAVADDGERHTWRIVGWRDSGEQITRAAEQLAAGLAPSGPTGVVDASAGPADAPPAPRDSSEPS
jgi:hypothetical protein